MDSFLASSRCTSRFSQPTLIRRGPRGFTILELLVIIGLIVFAIAMLLPTIQTNRPVANSVRCAANLRSIGQSILVEFDNNPFVGMNQDNIFTRDVFQHSAVINGPLDEGPSGPHDSVLLPTDDNQ